MRRIINRPGIKVLFNAKHTCLTLCCLFAFSNAFAQIYANKYRVKIKKATDEIVIDGQLQEESWKNADTATGFHQNFPIDSIKAESQSEARFTYDDRNFYIGIIAYDTLPGDYVVQSLRRDFDWPRNDNFSIYIDPFDDRTNGFTFGITPYGVQREGLVIGGGDVSTEWDNKWYSEVQNYPGRWVAEMRIPFKSFRYNDQITEWNIQFLRNDQKQNERSSWTPVKQQYQLSSMAFAGRLVWDDKPPEAGANISLIPFVTGSVSRDFEEGEDTEIDGDAGLDAKIAVSSSLNLDLTVNPDFSQVEVDRQVTNLDRFELFFPERRQFFLENNDLFGRFGFPRSRVFFSRRIGLESPIIAGARLSGKAGKNWRVGLLNVQTENQKVEEEDEDDIPSENFTVATFQRQVFARSNISGIFVNKQAVNFEKETSEGFDFSDTKRYNRVTGLEYNLLSSDERWEGDFYFFRSFSPDVDGNEYAHGGFLMRNTRNLRVGWSHELIGEDYDSEAGFVPRTGFYRVSPFLDVRFFPDSRVINRHGPNFEIDFFSDTDFDLTDRYFDFVYGVDFINTSALSLGFGDNFVKLLEDFDPTNQDEDDTTIVPLPAGAEFDWRNVTFAYQSDRRRTFFFAVEGSYGGFYNGDLLNISGNINYRIQPVFNFAFTYSFNKIDLAEPHPDAAFWLVGPRFDFTFTDKVFLTTFLQFNEQTDNINLNARFQWRFKPVSDLFIVYTDNYFPDGLRVKNRAVVIKLSYWFNV